MSHLITALTALIVGFGTGSIVTDAIFPRDTVTRVMESDLDNCYTDLDACEALRNDNCRIEYNKKDRVFVCAGEFNVKVE